MWQQTTNARSAHKQTKYRHFTLHCFSPSFFRFWLSHICILLFLFQYKTNYIEMWWILASIIIVVVVIVSFHLIQSKALPFHSPLKLDCSIKYMLLLLFCIEMKNKIPNLMKFLSSLALSLSTFIPKIFRKDFLSTSVLSLTRTLFFVDFSSHIPIFNVCLLTLIFSMSFFYPNPCHAFQFEFHILQICIHVHFVCKHIKYSCLCFILASHTFVFQVLNFCTSKLKWLDYLYNICIYTCTSRTKNTHNTIQ